MPNPEPGLADGAPSSACAADAPGAAGRAAGAAAPAAPLLAGLRQLLSLRQMLALAVVLGLLLPAIASGWLTMRQQRVVLLADLDGDAQRLANMLATGLPDPLWSFDDQGVQAQLHAAALDPRVLAIVVKPIDLEAFPDNTEYHRALGARGPLHAVELTMRRGTVPFASLRVEMDGEQMEARLAREIKRFAFAAIAQLVFSLVLILLILNLRFVQPLKRLLGDSARLARVELETPFSWRRSDELGTLGRSLETTRQALQSAFGQVEESAQRFRSLTALSSDWYWERDAQGGMVSVSQGFRDITGFEPEPVGSVRGVSGPLQFAPSAHRAACEAAIAARQPFHDMAWSAMHPDGRLRSGTLSGEPVFDNAGQFKGYRGIGKDLSAVRQAEAAQQNAARMRRLVEHLPAGAIYIEDGATLLNAAAEAITGYARADITNLKSWFDTAFGARAWEMEALYLADREAGFPTPLEVRIEHKSGTPRVVEFAAYADDQCEVWLLHDITERKRAETVLKQTMIEQQAILDNALVGIYLVDTERRFLRVNQRFLDMFGYLEHEVIGQSTELLYGSRAQFEQMGADYALLRAGQTYRAEFEWRRSDGSTIWVYDQGKSIDPDNPDLGFIWAVDDISARRAAQHQLQASKEALESTLAHLRTTQSQLVQSEKMAALGQLIAGVAHEINTPIGAVKSSGKNIADALEHALDGLPRLFQILDQQHAALFVAMIGCACRGGDILSTREERAITRAVTEQLELAGIEDARHKASILVQVRAHAQLDDFLPLLRHPERAMILNTVYSFGIITSNTANINTAVERVAKIVFALKSFSRYDQAGEMVEADLREGLETVLTIYQNQIKQHTELVRHYDEIAPITCLPDELNQVWTNLIHNALQAMPDGGTLAVAIARRGDEAVVSIADSGCGIAPEIRERIFDAFFTTKPAGQGSGLGLDIVKQIVERHRGRIELDSEPGRGSTFRICLPYLGA
ncbi:MAG: PAS domain S-box protein [Pseudomonadota bacterium]